MQSPLVLGGHSHIAAFASPPSNDPDTAPDVTIPNAGAPRDETYWLALADAAGGRPLALVWEGNQHMTALLGAPTPPLDFVLSHAPDLPLDPRASYVLESQMRALFAPSMDRLAMAIGGLRASAATVVVAGTPPPPSDEAALRRALLSINPGAVSLTANQPITAAFTLQKSWSLLQIMVGETATGNGVAFVPVPDRVRDDDGFLHAYYAAGDGLHANARFGEAMLADLHAALDTKGA